MLLFPFTAPELGDPVTPVEPVAAPEVPPPMFICVPGGVVPLPVGVPVLLPLPELGRLVELPFDPVPDDEPLRPPGVAPEMPVPVLPVGLLGFEPRDELPEAPLPEAPLPDEPLPDELPAPDEPDVLPDPDMLPEPVDMLPLPPDVLPDPDELLPDIPPPDMLPPLMLAPLLLPVVLERLARARRARWRRVLLRFLVPVLSCVVAPLLAPAVAPEAPALPPVVCADAASGRTAMVASVAMRFRMLIASERWPYVIMKCGGLDRQPDSERRARPPATGGALASPYAGCVPPRAVFAGFSTSAAK